MTTRTPLHRGGVSNHDRGGHGHWCPICTYVGAHTPAGITARRRRTRRGYMNAAHEAVKADLLGQADALGADAPRLRLVAGEAS